MIMALKRGPLAEQKGARKGVEKLFSKEGPIIRLQWGLLQEIGRPGEQEGVVIVSRKSEIAGQRGAARHVAAGNTAKRVWLQTA